MASPFVWFDLNTPQINDAVDFYTAVVGWQVEPWGPPDQPYLMFKPATAGPIGGVMPLNDQAKAMGAPPHWLGHVAVRDLEASLEKVQANGGRALSPVVHVPTVGRMAPVADNSGAVFSVFQPESAGMTPPSGEVVGAACWAEVLADSLEGALGFYGAVFGWRKVAEHNMPNGVYVILGDDENPMGFGGLMVKPMTEMTGAWMYYFHVADLDASVATATSRGASLFMPVMDVPGGRVAVMEDPQKAAFCLWGKPLPSAS